MDDVHLVQVVHTERDPRSQLQELVELQRRLLVQILQRAPPLHELRHQAEARGFRHRADQLHDVFMPHLPQDRQLLSELPAHLLLRALPSRLENLDGHLLAAVAAPVQHTERAARDLLHEVQLHLLNLPLAIAGSRERLLALTRRRPVARPRLHALVPIHLVQTLLQLLVHGNLVVHPPSGDHEHVQRVAVVRAEHVCLRNV